jgi:excisionase family DNA binding protein
MVGEAGHCPEIDAMSDSRTQSGSEEEVLTLAEAAAYLRVSEEELKDLLDRREIPGQRIGGSWRFLKRALADWLRFGPYLSRDLWKIPYPWMPDHPFWDELLHLLERRILSRLQPLSPKRGSNEAVLKHFGVFKDDEDLEEQLAGIRALREAGG